MTKMSIYETIIESVELLMARSPKNIKVEKPGILDKIGKKIVVVQKSIKHLRESLDKQDDVRDEKEADHAGIDSRSKSYSKGLNEEAGEDEVVQLSN